MSWKVAFNGGGARVNITPVFISTSDRFEMDLFIPSTASSGVFLYVSTLSYFYMDMNNNRAAALLNGSASFGATNSLLPYLDKITTYSVERTASNNFEIRADGNLIHTTPFAIDISPVSFGSSNTGLYLDMDLYEARFYNSLLSAAFIHRWDPTTYPGTGSTLEDTIGTNDGTLAGPAAFESLTNFTVTSDLRPGEAVTWTTDLTGITSAYLEDGSGNQYALTGVTDTGGNLPALAPLLQACLFGNVTATITDGVDTRTYADVLNPPTGYSLVTATSVPATPQSIDWVFGTDSPVQVGAQSLENSGTITHNVDGTTTGVSTPLTYTYYIVDLNGGVGEVTKTFEAEPLVAPTANAGPDQSVASSTLVTLDGTGSTGSGLTYLWTQTSGDPVTLSSNSVAQPTFTSPAVPATLIFQLQVTNGAGSDTDTVRILVDGGAGIPVENRGSWFEVAQYLRGDGYTGSTNDILYNWLGDEGYTTGSLNDRKFKYLGDLGYSGSLNDRQYLWFNDL